jgi:hypothetical protein
MNASPKDSDEAKFNATLKRLLDTPPKPHKQKDAGPKPDASQSESPKGSDDSGNAKKENR